MNSKLIIALVVAAVICIIVPNAVEGTYYKSYSYYPKKYYGGYGGIGYGKGYYGGYDIGYGKGYDIGYGKGYYGGYPKHYGGYGGLDYGVQY